MIEFSRSKRSSLSLDLAPLIDVVFLLLVFFMLTSSFIPPSLPLDLPSSENQEIAPVEPVVVSLDASGLIAINGEPVSAEAFGDSLKQALSQSTTQAVNFRGDRAVPYGTFLQLMDEARSVGAKKLHLIHQNP